MDDFEIFILSSFTYFPLSEVFLFSTYVCLTSINQINQYYECLLTVVTLSFIEDKILTVPTLE